MPSLRYYQVEPIAELAAYVENLWIISTELIGTLNQHWVMPELGVNITLCGHSWSAFDRSFFLGPSNRCFFRPAMASELFLGIRLKAGASLTLLGCDGEEISHRVGFCEELVGRRAQHLLERVNEAGQPLAALMAVQDELKSWIRTPLTRCYAVEQAVEAIHETAGKARLNRITDDLMSERHLRRQFKSLLGLSPKDYAQVVRLQALETLLLRSLETRRSISWSQIAARLGFVDQSHFIREFRRISGNTPTQYLQYLHSVRTW